ncbi:peptidase S8 and S53 subtilisin kexin sedolisin [Oscillochloris trichoides DG-6]|uniref:Peptidase S8 and S53 subtilisin kexin sedolisin n=1 Tax=Oscillochloris trichoides DG-6 TaxID=765420 RepID=E1IFK3_9CHLR|nr:peptidase S8 and S53 subtilisin kexin sedolisin [Oscillochloris trichoides DG-6]
MALLATLVAASLPPVAPRPALAASTPLTSSPAAISTSVTLTNTTQVTLSIQNSGATPITPQLYEALAAASGASLNTVVPAELAAVPLPDQAERVDPELSATFATDPHATTTMLVFLRDQAPLSAAYGLRDWRERGAYVYQTLYAHAERTQAGLRAMLKARRLNFTPLWIVNAIAVEGNAQDLAAIAARSEVALLQANHLTSLETSTLANTSNYQLDAANTSWNIVQVGADRVWNEIGVRGAGITVANIDSGVAYTHTALIGSYRGNTGSGEDHNYNWFDPYDNSNTPTYEGNHGTHTMGTMVASAVGVAPGATWIAARGCGSTYCLTLDLIEAAQWMLAPTDLNGQNPRPDLRPQIINNSWSSGAGNDSWYSGYVAAWRAAGIFPVFAAGNISTGNTTCSTVYSPGDYAQVVGVGAVNQSDQLASFSRIGPTSDGRLKPDLTAPGYQIVSTVSNLSYGSMNGTSMAAPHVAGAVALLWSANPSLIGDYAATYQLLTQNAVPISRDSSFDGSNFSLCHVNSSPNNVYGYGRLDAYVATLAARVDVPWLSLPSSTLNSLALGASTDLVVTIDGAKLPGPGTYTAQILIHSSDLTLSPLVIPVSVTVANDPGYATLSGQITRADDGSPLVGTVEVVGGASVKTDANGNYTLVVAAGNGIQLRANVRYYASQTVSLNLEAGAVRTQNFALSLDEPRLNASPVVQSASLSLGESPTINLSLKNTGSQPLTYSASLPRAQYGVWRSTQSDGPSAGWIVPPGDAIPLDLGDDGVTQLINLGFTFTFFGQSYTSVAISANGFLSFLPLGSFVGYATSCPPLGETSSAAIFPLRLDLNPGQGGTVSYARISEGFLVSWVDVPIFNRLTAPLTFQVLLHRDGRVIFNYKQVDGIQPSDLASVGIQQNSSTVQSLGCGSGLSLGNGQTIELRPQISTALWASLTGNTTGTIPAGGSVNIPVRLAWLRNPNGWDSSADVLVTSNDRVTPSTTLTVRMAALPATSTIYLPVVLR